MVVVMTKKVKKLALGLLAASLLGCGVSNEVTAHPPTAFLSEPTTTSVGGERPAHQAPASTSRLRPAAGSLAVVTTTRRPAPRAAARPAEAPAEAAPSLAMSALNRRIQSGRIIDEAGQPLVGATVLLKGTTRGTSTDANGDYALPVPLGTNTFVFAYTGYQDEVGQSRDGQPLTVTLLPVLGRAPAAPAQPAPETHLPKVHRRKARN